MLNSKCNYLIKHLFLITMLFVSGIVNSAPYIHEIEVGEAISKPIFNTKNDLIYITNHLLNGKLFIIDISKWKIVKEIKLGRRLFEPVLGKNGTFIYVASKDDQNISVINAETNEIVQKITLSEQCDSKPTYNSKLEHLYVPHHFTRKVSVIDLKYNKVINVIEFNKSINGEVILGPSQNILFIASHSNGSLLQVNIDNL